MERELARCKGFDVGMEDHGFLVLHGTFEYEGGSCQGIGGYFVDASFLMRFLSVFGFYTKVSEVNGESCWVTHDHSKVYKIEPLHKKDGSIFDIEEWSRWIEKRCPDLPSASECLSGKRP